MPGFFPSPDLFRHRTPDRALPPGTLQPESDASPPVATVLAFGPEAVQGPDPVGEPADLAALRERWPVVWVDVAGLGDADLLAKIGQAFDLHPLALEDVLSTHQRPKVESYEENHFIVLRRPELVGGQLDLEQISIFLGPGYVLSFRERPGECFEPLRERIRRSRGRVRRSGADYLVYAIVDTIVDQYFPLLDQLVEQLLDLEEEVIGSPRRETLARIYGFKRTLIALRRTISPLREALSLVVRGELEPVSPETQLYFRDCHDHTYQALEILDACRDTASSLMDLYQSSVAHRMNEVMKVLTMIATVFIPLSFIAGLYGMNFDPKASPWNMPELDTRYGYPVVLLVMLGIGLAMTWFFYRKGWIGGGSDLVLGEERG